MLAMNILREMFIEEVPQKRPLLGAQRDSKPTGRRMDASDVSPWMVAVGLFFSNFIIFGMSRVAGIFLVDFMGMFHVQREQAAMPYSVQQYVGMIVVGPALCVSNEKFGVTSAIIVGSLLCALGSAANYFADNLTLFVILWGVLYGVGTAWIGSASFILVDQYFAKYRNSAYGFIYSGTSAGAIILPVLLNLLSQEYGIRGTFLLMGSVILLVIPIGLFLTEKSEAKSASREPVGTISKYDSLSEAESALEAGPKFSSLDTERQFKNICTNNFPDNAPVEKITAKRRLSIASAAQEKDFSGSTSYVEFGMTQDRRQSRDALEVSETRTEDIDENYNTRVKSGYEIKGKDDETISTKSLEFKHFENSSDETVVEIPSETNSFETAKTSSVIDVSKDLSSGSENYYTISSVIEKIEKYETMSHSSKKDPTSYAKSKTQTTDDIPTKKHNKRKRVIKADAYRNSKKASLDPSNRNTRQTPRTYANEINFKVLHENMALVLELLTKKIPLSDEEVMPSSGEVTQSNLESSDTEFISRELQRIEYQLQRPIPEVQKFLINIQKKLNDFNELLNADRCQFSKEKKLDFEDKELTYKDIRNTTIKKPDCTIEITEYSFEIPVDLYIPIKLQELNERDKEHISSLYLEDKRILKILPELKKLHEIFSTPTGKYSFKYDDFLEKHPSQLNRETSYYRSVEPTREPQEESTFKNRIMIALKLHLNIMFLLVCISRTLTVLTFVPIVTSIVDFAMDKGLVSCHRVYAVAVLSAGDFAGRLSTGWFTDQTSVKDKNYMSVASVLQGVFTAILPLMSGAEMLLPALAVFAYFQGSLFVKHPMVLMNYVGKHEKYIGLGVMNFLPGIIGISVPYYIGYFRDHLGSYDMMFYINGGLSAGVGCLWILEPVLSRFLPATEEIDVNTAAFSQFTSFGMYQERKTDF